MWGGRVSILTVAVRGASVRPSASFDQNVRMCSPSLACDRGAPITTLAVACTGPPSTCTNVAATVDMVLVALNVTVTSWLCQRPSTPVAVVTGGGPSGVAATGDVGEAATPTTTAAMSKTHPKASQRRTNPSFTSWSAAVLHRRGTVFLLTELSVQQQGLEGQWGGARGAPPYPGIKPFFLIEDGLDERGWLTRLVRAMANELPAPKATRRRQTRG